MFLEEDDDASVAAEQTKQSLVDTQARMGMMLDLMPMGLLIHTRQGIIFANQEAARMLQVSQADLVGRHFLDFVQTHADAAECQIEGAFAGEINANSTEADIRTAADTVRTIKLMAGGLPWDGNAVVQLLLQDITELKFIQETLHRLTITDELTGAYNRRHAFSTANALLRRDPPGRLNAAILDIDHFKLINDTFGHASGDVAIRTLSETVKHTLSEAGLDQATFARVGGEEFIILLPDMDIGETFEVCEGVRCALEQQQIVSTSGVFKITVSIGISSSEPGANDFDTIFANADTALYQAKQTGRNRVCVDCYVNAISQQIAH